MEEIGVAAKAVTEYGVLLILCIVLLKYVYNQQQKLNTAAEKREAEYQKYITTLKDEIYKTACDSNGIIRTVSDEVDKLHDKVETVGEDVDKIKTDVADIRRNVDHIQNTMVIRAARKSEDDE